MDENSEILSVLTSQYGNAVIDYCIRTGTPIRDPRSNIVYKLYKNDIQVLFSPPKEEEIKSKPVSKLKYDLLTIGVFAIFLFVILYIFYKIIGV